MASARCSILISLELPKSAHVRATFRILSYALADSWSFSIAVLSSKAHGFDNSYQPEVTVLLRTEEVEVVDSCLACVYLEIWRCFRVSRPEQGSGPVR